MLSSLLSAFARFSMSEYVFAEEQGTGSVTVEGSSGVTVRVFGGTLYVGQK